MRTSFQLKRIPPLPAAITAGALSLAASSGYHRLATRRDLTRYPLPGTLVSAGGRRLHTLATGMDNPGPTVILEAGLSCPLDIWSWIQPAVSLIAPVISYDRAGLGGSDAARGMRTAADMIDDLDKLLAAVGAKAPYVLVGHSFGGLLVRAFTDRHPSLVAGIVLADASHPDQLKRSRRQRKGMPIMRAELEQAATMALLGLNRLTKRQTVTGIDTLSPDAFARARARMITAKSCRTAVRELDAWLNAVNDEVRDSAPPAGCPLAVITAGQVSADDPVHDALQAELAGLSVNAIRHVVPEADHLGLVMNQAYASQVVHYIARVIAAARSGTPVDSDPSLLP